MLQPIDMFEVMKGRYVPSLLTKNLFLKRWGTTMVDGVEVFNLRQYLFPTMTDDMVYLLKKLKMYDNVKEGLTNTDGIDNVYMYFNQGKLATKNAIIEDQVFANKLEDIFPFGEELSMTVNVLDATSLVSMSELEVIDYLTANWGPLIATGTVQSVSDADVDAAEGKYYKYVMFDYGNEDREFEIEVSDLSIQSYTVQEYSKFQSRYTTVRKNSLSCTVKFRRISGISISSSVVDGVQTSYSNKVVDIGDNSTASIPVYFAEKSAAYDDLFHTGTDGNTYLRVDVLTNPAIGVKLFLVLVQECLDTGYTKESVPFWKKVATVIVVVAAVYFSGGLAGGLAATATGLSVAALTFTVLSMYFAKNGEAALSAWQGERSQPIGKAAMVVGIGAMIQQGVKMWLSEKATTEAAKAAARSTVIDIGLQVTNTTANMYYSNQLGKLEDRLASKQEELDAANRKLYEAEADEVDVPFQLMQAMYNPLSALSQEFDIDYLYGPHPGEGKNEFGTITRKNICRRSF